MNDEELVTRLLDETDRAWSLAVGLRHDILTEHAQEEAHSKLEWVRFLYSEYILRNLKELCIYDEWWIREVIDTLSELLLRDKAV